MTTQPLTSRPSRIGLEPAAVPRLERVPAQGRVLGFAALCLALAMLLAVKYYPLRPTMFVLSQYLWTMEVGDVRRSIVSTLAGLAWHGDPSRFLAVVDLVSLVAMAGLALALAWGAVRVAGRPVPRLALLLLLCSGAVPHLLATRGSQDGFAALALIGLAASLEARRAWPAALLGAVAVAVHEGSIVYVVSVCGLHLVLTDVEPSTGWREVVRRIAHPDLLPTLAGLGAATVTLVAVVTTTHLPPDVVADLCRRNDWIATVGGLDAIRNIEPGSPAQRWAATCGLQFRTFAPSPGFVLRSVPVGALHAPVSLVALLLLARARLPVVARLGAAASLLLPALLPFIATDVTRFWSYMNFTALYGLVLLVPHLRGFGRLSPGGLLGAVLAMWIVVAVGIDQWPTGWPQPPSALPDAVSLRVPTFRDALCAASRRGLCDRPTTEFH